MEVMTHKGWVGQLASWLERAPGSESVIITKVCDSHALLVYDVTISSCVRIEFWVENNEVWANFFDGSLEMNVKQF